MVSVGDTVRVDKPDGRCQANGHIFVVDCVIDLAGGGQVIQTPGGGFVESEYVKVVEFGPDHELDPIEGGIDELQKTTG